MDRRLDDSGLSGELTASVPAASRLLAAISARASASIDETPENRWTPPREGARHGRQGCV